MKKTEKHINNGQKRPQKKAGIPLQSYRYSGSWLNFILLDPFTKI